MSTWRSQLGAWRIPPEILAGAAANHALASPWTLPVAMFTGRARTQLAAPSGLSYQMAVEALPIGGSVLDVGAGAGAASLALSERADRITAVDENTAMLASFTDLVAAHTATANVTAETVEGRWPDVAPRVAVADVVVCHHVLYNVPDLEEFVAALTAHARRRVVVEITAQHPAALLNPLWMMLYGIERPRGPVAADAVTAIAATGVEPRWQAWSRPITQDGTSYRELIDSICRRLCLGPERLGDVEAALGELGVRHDRPFLGPSTRDLVTVWWDV